jgi:hypothetical protein
MFHISVVYEGDTDNNDEEEALRVEDELETNTEDLYKQHTESVSDVMQPQGVISGGNRGSEVLGQAENSQRRPKALDIAAGTTGPRSLRNQQGSYIPLDILLIPGTNTPTNTSGIIKKPPEDSRNENRDTKKSAANMKV